MVVRILRALVEDLIIAPRSWKLQTEKSMQKVVPIWVQALAAAWRGKGEVTISGGDVTAHGGHTAACIGGGFRGSGDVTILGGTVTAIPAEGSNSNVTGIGGGFGCDEKSTVRILGGVVDAVGNGCGSGIGGGEGDAQGAEVEIGGGAQVTAKAAWAITSSIAVQAPPSAQTAM